MTAAINKILLPIGFLSFCLLTTTCSTVQDKHAAADTVYTVQGVIRGLDSGWVRLAYYDGSKVVEDSARVAQGKFDFHGTIPFPYYTFLNVPGQQDKGSVGFYLENGTTNISASIDSLSSAAISGTPSQEEFKLYAKGIKRFDDRMTALDSAYSHIPDKNFRKISDSLNGVYDKIINEKLLAIKDYVIAHPESFVAAAEVTSNFYYNPKVDQLDSIYTAFAPVVKKSGAGEKILEMLTVAKSTDIGRIAPDFTMNDVNEKPVALSSTRGKVVLLDFWASWCGPCREENPNVVEAYQKFHSKGFDVFSVSLDTKKEKWLAAIKKDNLTWNHVSDLAGWKSAAGKLYGIRGIPMSFLLDKDGKVIGKNLRGDALKKKLAEILI